MDSQDNMVFIVQKWNNITNIFKTTKSKTPHNTNMCKGKWDCIKKYNSLMNYYRISSFFYPMNF